MTKVFKPLRNCQIKPPIQASFQAGLRQQNWDSMHSDPYMSVNNPHIQAMDPNMQQNFHKLIKFVLSKTHLMVNRFSSGKKSDSNDNNSSLYTADVNDLMNTKMSEFPTEDHIPLSTSTSGDKSHPQITTQLSPLMAFSRNKSDPQITLKPTTLDLMSSSNLPYH